MLERAVAELQVKARSPQGDAGITDTHEETEDFWILEGLRRREPRGAVAFAGHVQLDGGSVQWQWGRAADDLLVAEWESGSARIEALAHPVRLHLLQRVLAGAGTTGELRETEELGTTGQLHHHLRILVAAGWLESPARGRYRVPSVRVIPLLAVMSAVL